MKVSSLIMLGRGALPCQQRAPGDRKSGYQLAVRWRPLRQSRDLVAAHCPSGIGHQIASIGRRLAVLLLQRAKRCCGYTARAAALPVLPAVREEQSRQRRRYCASRPRVKAGPLQSGEPRTRARRLARRAARPGTSAAACTARRTYSSSQGATQPSRMSSTASSETPTLCAWHRPAPGETTLGGYHLMIESRISPQLHSI